MNGANNNNQAVLPNNNQQAQNNNPVNRKARKDQNPHLFKKIENTAMTHLFTENPKSNNSNFK